MPNRVCDQCGRPAASSACGGPYGRAKLHPHQPPRYLCGACDAHARATTLYIYAVTLQVVATQPDQALAKVLDDLSFKPALARVEAWPV